MLRSVTQGTSKDSIIFVATVVLPEALPPQIPKTIYCSQYRILISFEGIHECASYPYYPPITKGSTCCPAELYHGGLPAVYIVLVLLLRIDSAEVFLLDWDKLVVLCLLDLGDL